MGCRVDEHGARRCPDCVCGLSGSQLFKPAARLTVKRIDAPTADHQVRFEIRNHADRTAASVLVHGEARKPDGSVEVAETTFDYVPGRSRTTGALIFSTDVTDADVTIRPAGYMDP